MMTARIECMSSVELQMVAGGVTEGPDGKSCTEHDLPDDGKGVVDIVFSNMTIEIDPNL